MEIRFNQLGTLRPDEWYCGEFPGFSFCFIYPRLRAEEVSNSEISVGTDINEWMGDKSVQMDEWMNEDKACPFKPKD